MDSASGGPVWQKDVQYVLYCYIRLKLDSPLVTEHCTYGGVIWCYASTVSSTLRYRVTQLKKHVVCRDMALHVLNLSSGLTYDFSFTLHPLYPQGTIPKYRKEREGPQCLHGRCPWQTNQNQTKVLTGGGDLREAQVDVPLSVSHSCVWSQSWAQ